MVRMFMRVRFSNYQRRSFLIMRVGSFNLVTVTEIFDVKLEMKIPEI